MPALCRTYVPLATGLLLLTGWPYAAPGQEPNAAGERIVYGTSGPGPQLDPHFAAVTLKDKKVHRLTDPSAQLDRYGPTPVVSRDGKFMAYLADGSAPPEGGLVTFTLYVRPLDEPKGKGRSLEVTKCTHLTTWSPDGGQLIVGVQEGDEARQLLVNVKTKETKLLPLPKAEPRANVSHSWGHFVTDWSPDGKWFLSICSYYDEKTEKRGADVYLVKSDGSAAERLKHIPSGYSGRFSPNGKRILFIGPHTENDKTTDQLYVADIAGGIPVRISQELNGWVGLWGFCWAPDGKRVAYVWDNREPGDDHEVFLMVVDADGKNPHVLCSQKSNGFARFSSPNWVTGTSKK